MSQNAPLSFGIELELCLAWLPRNASDPNPEDRRAVFGLEHTSLVPDPPNPDVPANYFDGPEGAKYTHLHFNQNVANSLMRSGLSARPDWMPDVYRETPASRAGIWQTIENYCVPYDTSHLASKWNCGVDASIDVPWHSDYHFQQIEVASPAFWYSPEAIRDVCVGVETLLSNYRVLVNSSCGLHVHVGHGNLGFELSVSQHLMAFLWLFSPVLDNLHPPERVSGIGNHYCGPLREGTCLAAVAQRNRLSLLETLRVILETRDQSIDTFSEKSLGNLFTWNAGGKAAYKFDLLADDWAEEADHKRTIEFRQHAGSLNTLDITAWIHTVVGIVNFARSSSRLFMVELLTEHAIRETENRSISVFELLELIGLPEQAAYYRKREAPKIAYIKRMTAAEKLDQATTLLEQENERKRQDRLREAEQDLQIAEESASMVVDSVLDKKRKRSEKEMEGFESLDLNSNKRQNRGESGVEVEVQVSGDSLMDELQRAIDE